MVELVAVFCIGVFFGGVTVLGEPLNRKLMFGGVLIVAGAALIATI